MSKDSSSSSSSGSWFDKAKAAANQAAEATKKAANYVAEQSKQTYDNLRAPPARSVDACNYNTDAATEGRLRGTAD